MIIWKIGSTLDFGIICLIPHLGVQLPPLGDNYITQILEILDEYPN